MSVGSDHLARGLLDRLGVGQLLTSCGQSAVAVGVQDWVAAARCARDELDCVLFDHLMVADAGGPGEQGAQWGTAWDVVLHVVALPAQGLLVRTTVSRDGVLPSVSGVWAGAAWPEREAAEMAGLEVSGHPDLRPLLLAPGAGLRPLRKEALLVSRSVRAWPGRLEPGEDGSGQAPRAGRRRVATPGVAPEGWAQA